MEITYLGDFDNTISVYMIGNEAIIDPGPYSATEGVINAIRSKGFKLRDVRYIILTHLHIDHAGNAWKLLEYMPDAKIVIHHKAVKYLVDPEELVRSSREVLGSIIDRWGEPKPIPEQKFIGVDDNHTLNDSIRFIATPGHAPYHMSVLVDDDLFTGDAIGIKYADTLRPASPLPSFRYDLALSSIEKIKGMNLKRFYMPHFGIADANEAIEDNLRVYTKWAEIIEESIKNNLNEQQILELINREFKYEALLADDFTKRLLLSDLRGFIRYFKNK